VAPRHGLERHMSVAPFVEHLVDDAEAALPEAPPDLERRRLGAPNVGTELGVQGASVRVRTARRAPRDLAEEVLGRRSKRLAALGGGVVSAGSRRFFPHGDVRADQCAAARIPRTTGRTPSMMNWIPMTHAMSPIRRVTISTPDRPPRRITAGEASSTSNIT